MTELKISTTKKVDIRKPQKRHRRTFGEDSRYYVDNAVYNKLLTDLKKGDQVSDELGKMFLVHVNRLSTSSGFKNYTYIDEMRGHALLTLIKYAHNFDPDKRFNAKGERFRSDGPNAFAYCTTIISSAFVQIIKREKIESEFRQKMYKFQKECMAIIDNMSSSYEEQKQMRAILEEDPFGNATDEEEREYYESPTLEHFTVYEDEAGEEVENPTKRKGPGRPKKPASEKVTKKKKKKKVVKKKPTKKKKAAPKTKVKKVVK